MKQETRDFPTPVIASLCCGLTAMLPTDGIPDHLKDYTISVSSGART